MGVQPGGALRQLGYVLAVVDYGDGARVVEDVPLAVGWAESVEGDDGGSGAADAEHDADQLPGAGQVYGDRMAGANSGRVQARCHPSAGSFEFRVVEDPIAVLDGDGGGGAAGLAQYSLGEGDGPGRNRGDSVGMAEVHHAPRIGRANSAPWWASSTASRVPTWAAPTPSRISQWSHSIVSTR